MNFVQVLQSTSGVNHKSYQHDKSFRCRVLEFKATKSQKKILKRFNKYLTGQEPEQMVGDAGRKMSTCSSGIDEEQFGEGREHYVESNKEHQNIDVNVVLSSSEMIEESVNEDNISSTDTGEIFVFIFFFIAQRK